jgi:hypothetical protein
MEIIRDTTIIFIHVFSGKLAGYFYHPAKGHVAETN